MVALLVDSGWSVSEVRTVLKGDNAAIGAEIQSARERLGMVVTDARTLHVRDAVGERQIPFGATPGHER